MKTSLKASLIATAIAAIPFGSQAAGLGTIQVFSGLGQPLRAEIQLSATPQELQSLTARIAPPEAFRQANVSYSSAVAGVRVAVETRGQRSVVRLSSDRPIDDPFVDLLVELNWASGRMIREYTFLLDPIELNAGTRMAAAPVATPVAAAAAPAASVTRTSRASTGAEPAAGRYQVQRGDTLRAIAERHRPQGTSLDQMLVALLRENPTAFDEGNINRLRAGAILTLPSEATLRSTEPAQARREVLAQSADFEAYRRRLAGTVAARPAATDEASSRSASGTITTRVEEDVRRASPGDRVQVSGAASEDGVRADGEAGHLVRLQALEEELAARGKALEDAQSRVAELEASIRDMQRLLQLKSPELAQLQEQAASRSQEPLAAVGETPEEIMPQAAVGEAIPADMPVAEAAPLTVAVEQTVAAPQEAAPQPPAVKQPAKPAARPAPAPVQPAPEPSLFDTMLEDPTLLAGGGGVLLLLLGYAGYKVRERRKAEAAALETLAPLSELPPETNSVFGVTGGQSVDTGSSSVIHTDFSQSGLSAIDADEGVDPVAEADVYMAYGRDAQAEEILLDALKADSSRAAIFLKLLEIYAHRKDSKQFENVATDLYSRTNGEGAEWAKAAEMGRRLDPDNPLYGASPIAQVQAPATEMPPHGDAAAGARGAAGAGALAVSGLAGVAEGADESVASFTGGGTSLADLDFTSSFPKAPPIINDTAEPTDPVDKTVPAAEHLDALPQLDSSTLDFDLGDEVDGPPVSPEAGKSSAPPASLLTASQGLMLDLDLGSGGEASGKPLDVAGEVNTDGMNETVVGTGSDIEGLSASLDFDLGGEATEEKNDPADAFDMHLTALDTTALSAPALVGNKGVAMTDLEQSTFDSSLLDFQFDLEAAASGSSKVPALNLTGIDLALDASGGVEPKVNGQARSVLPDPAGQQSVAAFGEDVAQEVDTKLELASAYEEMGDKEGARELVEEVLREGTGPQREAANRLLERLA